MTNQQNTTLIALALMCCTTSASPAYAQKLTLAQVIANVESNEQLYKDIEVIRNEVYQLAPDAVGVRDNLITKQTRQRRSVTQGNMFYLRVSGGQDLVDKKSYMLSDLYGYDGEVTRVVKASAPTKDDGKNRPIVNINHKKLNPCDIYVPHTWATSITTCITPLSVLLRGGKEFQNYPGNGVHKNAAWTTALEGEEVVDGLRCVKLRLEVSDVFPNKVIPNGRFFLWLAVDRNYLPYKADGIVLFENPDVVLSETRVKDFREISPGIWLPFEKEALGYDHIALRKETDKTKRIVRNIHKETIELVKLDPKYDISFFRDIEIPAKSVVYEVDKGKIVDTYIQPGEPPAGFATRYRWWIAAVAAVVAVTGIYLWWRVRRARKAAS